MAVAPPQCDTGGIAADVAAAHGCYISGSNSGDKLQTWQTSLLCMVLIGKSHAAARDNFAKGCTIGKIVPKMRHEKSCYMAVPCD